MTGPWKQFLGDSSGWKCLGIILIKNALCGILFQRVNSKRLFTEPHLARCLGISIGN